MRANKSREQKDEAQRRSQQQQQQQQQQRSSLIIRQNSLLSFDLVPKLVLFPPKTNLYDTPASWLLDSADPHGALAQINSLASFIESQENVSGEAPDFATDNKLLRELISWRFSDKMVSIVIQRFGNTLVLQTMNPLFTGPPCLPQHSAQLISGFNILEPEESLESATKSVQTTSLEEQSRLKAKANEEMLKHKRRKKNLANQKRAQLMSKLHCRIMEQNEFRALRSEDSVSIHRWHHKEHCVALASDLMVYSYKKRLTSLSLRDEQDGPHSKASVARLFLDNIMAGVPQLAICWHEDGVIRKYDTMKTQEIPERLSRDEPFDITELERTATAQLAFLKTKCLDDFSVHWLFKGEGDHVARLWRLDPFHDCSLDWEFRDKVLYQLAMFCLRASHQDTRRRFELLGKCAELLDAAAVINLRWNSSPVSVGQIKGVNIDRNLRRALRAGVRERVVDVTLETIRWASISVKEKLLSLTYALESASLGIKLLVEEKEDVFGGTAAASALISRMKERLEQKRLTLLTTALEIIQKAPDELNKLEMTRLFQTSHVALADFSGNLCDLDSERYRLIGECRLQVGGLAMRLARIELQDEQPDWKLAENLLVQAIEEYYPGALECSTEDSLERKRVLGLRGNALNELGKLRLSQGALFSAIESFREAIQIFMTLTDLSNVELIRCNIAHCYRVAAAHVREGEIDKKVTLLRLAETELQLGVQEVTDSSTPSMEGVRKKLAGELFRTRIQIGTLLREPPNALVAFEAALESATSPEEIAISHFHLGQAYSKMTGATSLKLARRYLQKAVEKAFTSAFRARAVCALGRLEERPEARLRALAHDEHLLQSDCEDPGIIEELKAYVSQAYQLWVQHSQHTSRSHQAYREWLNFIARPPAPLSIGALTTCVRQTLA